MDTVKANAYCAGLKKLRDLGTMSQDEIVQKIQDDELPLGLHLHIMAHYTHVTTQGRLWNKRDEKLRKLMM